MVYVGIGEARQVYGSAAALSLMGHQTCVIQPDNNLGSIKPSCVEVEIGTDSKTKRVKVKTINVPKDVLGKPERYASPKQFLSAVRSLDPEVFITESNSWFVAKSAAKKLNIPLLLWGLRYSIFKIFLYLPNRAYSRSLMTPFGFFYTTYKARHSSYVMAHEMSTTKIMKRLGIKHVETIWPTYARFVKKDAYAEFLPQTDYVHTDEPRCSNPYVLSLMALDSKTAVYKTELRSLKFVRSVALAMPDTDFVVIGASIEAINNHRDYAEVKNLRLIGLVHDEAQMSKLYRNALCFLYPYSIPGFSNRLMEAFFYGKAIVTTSLTNKYYSDFVPNSDVVFADSPDIAVEALKKISSSEYCRREFEDASRSYYLTHYSPETHAKAVERVLEYVGR